MVHDSSVLLPSEGSEGTAQRQGTDRRVEAATASKNSAANLQSRRTFSVDEGGIRLPSGVRLSSQEAAE